jgi:chemotaxis protein CheD
MGQIAVGQGEGSLRTLLGSCIGLVLYDRRLKLGGLAHIVLPKTDEVPELPGKFANTAVPAVIQQLEKILENSQRLKLSAKIAGGANMFGSNGIITIGEQNIQAIETILSEQRIPIVARHLGGEQGRRLALDLSTGLVTVEIVGMGTITL